MSDEPGDEADLGSSSSNELLNVNEEGGKDGGGDEAGINLDVPQGDLTEMSQREVEANFLLNLRANFNAPESRVKVVMGYTKSLVKKKSRTFCW